MLLIEVYKLQCVVKNYLNKQLFAVVSKDSKKAAEKSTGANTSTSSEVNS